MKQRIADGQLKKLATDIERFPDNSRFIGHEVVAALVLDLADARTRLSEMERLSASQAEALDMMDRGVKL